MKQKFLRENFNKLLFFGAVVSILFLTFASAARAQTTTFAQFLENSGSQDFVFTNASTSANFKTVSGGSSVSFRYQNISGLDTSLQNFQSAHLSIAATTTTTPATLTGSTLRQPLNQTIVISIIRDTATATGVGSGTRRNLLTATISTGSSVPSITGTNGDGSAGFNVSSQNYTVVFTSDFLSFTATTQRDLGLTFSSVTPVLGLGTGNFLQSFTAAGTGTFASNPVPVVANPPTAATVSIGGRVLTPSGSGLGGARVSLIESDGSTRTIMTNPLGYYNFYEVGIGQTAILSVNSKRYSYAPQVISVTEDIGNFNFTAEQ